MFGKRRKKAARLITSQNDAVCLIKDSLDSKEIKYEYDAVEKVFTTGVMGDDLPIAINICIDQLAIHFFLNLDMCAKPENFNDVAWNLNCINKKLAFGAFYLDPEDGDISFEYGLPYIESDMSEEFILSFIKLLVKTVDEHDGDLKKIAEKVDPDRNRMYG